MILWIFDQQMITFGRYASSSHENQATEHLDLWLCKALPRNAMNWRKLARTCALEMWTKNKYIYVVVVDTPSSRQCTKINIFSI
ncbi:hypothetical protein EGR_06969 [Echinococcus granulosus]|uniref:Uncharacterized protein n=1 Tax=Echinococcus granulosus TaxID=6210 RepID=W6UAW5_ECHGR|nr:hypothetical protein EGR_06969 [Echinococcus granulosus]EUB58225.1 hypothetical protein EGR_06969 [Echinococcus granulosus]